MNMCDYCVSNTDKRLKAGLLAALSHSAGGPARCTLPAFCLMHSLSEAPGAHRETEEASEEGEHIYKSEQRTYITGARLNGLSLQRNAENAGM